MGRFRFAHLVCLLPLLLLSWACTRQPELPLPLPPELSAAALGEQQAAVAQVRAEDPALLPLDQVLRERNRAELAVLRREAGAGARLVPITRLSQQVMAETLAREGPARYRALASRVVEASVAALAQGLDAIRAAGGPEEFLARADPAGQPYREFQEQYGSFLLAIARPSGLLYDRGLADPDLLPFARAILTYRLLQEAGRPSRTELPLPPALHRIFLRWKVERGATVPRPKRLEALEELARLEPDYPVDAARRLVQGAVLPGRATADLPDAEN